MSNITPPIIDETIQPARRSRELTKRVYVSFTEGEYESLTSAILKASATKGIRSHSSLVRELAITQLMNGETETKEKA
ncbi:hypothetical protein [Chamaesiphon sp.]|uniref:hypothetical protein n=1 Tax=Chamaesiphon sp. TaxID=2814140 RepID=UPI0035943666